jgi:CheY-like chemotaxis protein
MRPDATKSAPAQTTQIRILILDPQPIVRKGLTDLINDEPDMAVCGESETAAHALELVRAEQPDVAIVDPSLSFEGGLAFIRSSSSWGVASGRGRLPAGCTSRSRRSKVISRVSRRSWV